MTQRRLLLALVLGSGCLAREAEPMDGATVVYRGVGQSIADDLLLTTDGRLRCGHPEPDSANAAEGVLQLTASREALRTNGDVFYLSCSAQDPLPQLVYATQVASILGPLTYRGPDGSVFTSDANRRPLLLPDLRGAASCNSLVCLVGGTAVPNTGRPAIRQHSPVAVAAQGFDGTLAQHFEGSGFSGDRLLAGSGDVFSAELRLAVDGPATVTFQRIDGLPPIVRMDGWFMYDAEGNAYYAGSVWAPDAPPHLQDGLSTTMLPSATATFDCPKQEVKVTSTCVGPTLVPKLKDARMGSIYGLATYAIQPDGTVKCWATEPTRYPSTAPRCLSFD